LDQFGYDYSVSRTQQRNIVWSVHTAGLKAFVNAWNVDDALGAFVDATNNPTGLATRLSTGDYYLAESFTIEYDQYDDADGDGNGIKDFQDKAEKMRAYKTVLGVKLAAITTTAGATFDQNKYNYAYLTSALNNFDSFGWGEEYYAASSCNIPLRTNPGFGGTAFTTPIITQNGLIERQSNVGIVIDTVNHTAATTL